MQIRFISIIKRANKGGTGFFFIPKDRVAFFNLGDWTRVKLSKDTSFFARIVSYSYRTGVYVPRRIMMKNELLNKEINIQIEKVDGFSARIYSDGRIYIPKDVVKDQQLKHNDIILLKRIEQNKIIQEKYSKIHMTRRKNRLTEYLCVSDKKFYNKEILFQIKKYSRQIPRNRLNSLTKQLLKNMIPHALIDKSSAIIFRGNKVPVIINADLNFSDLAFYLGAYFADGTKVGNSWAICASTFEQAKYYFKMHNLLIKNSKPGFTISFTNVYKTDKNKLAKNLTKIWKDNTKIEVNKFRTREAKGKLISKWNPCGTLVIKEDRQILLDFYNKLLQLLIKEILVKQDRKLAIDFICGVMEGDGCASATRRGHVMIFTNKNDVFVLQDILKVAQIKFKTTREGKNKYTLRIGALEILKNFHLLNDQIFTFYPKRRRVLLERLKTVGAVKFLIGNHEPASWVKTWLKDNKFCDNVYNITPRGIKLGQELVYK